MVMVPPKEASLHTVDSSVASKDKKIDNGGMGSADQHPQNPNTILQLVEEEHSSPAFTSEKAADEHEPQLPAEG